MPCWFDPTIKLGDVLIAGSGLFAAWWVGHIIQQRDANARAIKELVGGLCVDLLVPLAQLSELISACPPNHVIPETSRHAIMGALTAFSNVLMIVEEAIKQWGIESTKCASLLELKTLREELRSGILDPLASAGSFDAIQLRQVHGEISKTKLTIVKFKLQVIKDF